MPPNEDHTIMYMRDRKGDNRFYSYGVPAKSSRGEVACA